MLDEIKFYNKYPNIFFYLDLKFKINKNSERFYKSIYNRIKIQKKTLRKSIAVLV